MTYPDPRMALVGLLDDTTHADHHVTAWVRLPADTESRAGQPENALALIYTTGGREGWIDRVDYCTVEVYAPAATVLTVAESIRAALCGDPALDGHEGRAHETPLGYLDGIRCEVTPHDVPFASDRAGLARMVLWVTSRPTD